MMREIKFRAWDKNDAVMRDWENLMATVYYHKGDTVFNDNGLIITQYTGLKDCKGNEIYEGDIIKCKYGKATIESIEDIHQSLGWRDRKENSKCSDIGRTIEKFENEIEIIGNIYENKKLLKQQ